VLSQSRCDAFFTCSLPIRLCEHIYGHSQICREKIHASPSSPFSLKKRGLSRNNKIYPPYIRIPLVVLTKTLYFIHVDRIELGLGKLALSAILSSSSIPASLMLPRHTSSAQAAAAAVLSYRTCSSSFLLLKPFLHANVMLCYRNCRQDSLSLLPLAFTSNR